MKTVVSMITLCMFFFSVVPGMSQEPIHKENGKDSEELTIPEMVQEQGSVTFGGIGDSVSDKFQDLEALIKESRFVLKGRITSVKSYLSPSQKEIRTDFKIKVLEMIDSQSPDREPPEPVVMMLLGGKMKFPKGTAEFRVGDYPPDSYPVVGQVLVLFLETNLLDSTKFQPVGGPKGIFTITSDMIDSPVSRTSELHGAIKGKRVNVFEQEIKDKSNEARRPQ
jgi:hypothetical protein